MLAAASISVPSSPEVLIRHQPAPVRLVRHLLEQLPSDPVPQKLSPVSGEHRRIEARFHQVHAQEPAVEQVVVQFLAEGSLTRHRVQRLQQQRLGQTLGWHRGPPTFEYIQVKSLDMRSSTSAAARLMVLSGWSGGTRSSRLTKAGMVDWGLRRPLMGRSPG